MEDFKSRKLPGLKCLLPWYVPTLKPVNLKTPDEWRVQHDEVSATVRRILIILIGYCFFSMLSLGISDVSVVLSNSKTETIKIPFASIKVSFIGFVVIGPLVLLGLSVYLHIFVTYLVRLGRDGHTNPYLFNLNSPMPRLLAFTLLYILPLCTIFLYTYRSLPIEIGGWLTIFTSIVIIMFLRIMVLHLAYRTSNIESKKRLSILQGVVTSVIIGFIVVQLIKLTLYDDAWVFKRDYSMKNENLDGRVLRYVKMDNINLKEASLVGADFSSTSLLKSNLSNIRAYEANFKNADLSESMLIKADFTGANLSDSVLKNANLESSNMTEATLDQAMLQGTNLRLANLTNAKFIGARLMNVSMSGATIKGASFRRAIFWNNRSIDVNGKNIRAQVFADGRLIDVDFTGARIFSGRFNCDYVHGERPKTKKALKKYRSLKLVCTRILRTKINGTYMYGSQLRGATIQNVKFNCTKDLAKVLCTNLSYSNFGCSFANRIKPNCTSLRDVTFQGARMTRANFTGAYLSRVKFICSKFKKSQLSSGTSGYKPRLAEAECTNLYNVYFTCTRPIKGLMQNLGLNLLKGFAETLSGSRIYSGRKCASLFLTVFSGVNVTSASFQGARLRFVKFTCVNNSKLKWQCVNARRVRFGCLGNNFRQRKCSQLGAVTFEGTNLTRANFNGARISGSKFGCTQEIPVGLEEERISPNVKKKSAECVKLLSAKFSCVMFGDKYSCTRFRRVSFTGANLVKSNFSGAELKRVSFNCLIRSNEKQKCADMAEVNFGCVQTRNDKKKCTSLNEVLFEAANLKNADFSGTKFKGTVFRCLKAVDGAKKCVNMEGVNLLNASFEKQRRSRSRYTRTDLRGVVNLTCDQLRKARHWEDTLRNKQLACGRPIPRS